MGKAYNYWRLGRGSQCQDDLPCVRIDVDSYRVEVHAALKIALADEDGEIAPEAEMDKLSNILKAFNDQFGHIEWRDVDKIGLVIGVEIPARVAADKAYQNACRNADCETARIEHDKALQRVMIDLLSDHTELFKQFSDNESFRKWLAETIFWATYPHVDNPRPIQDSRQA